MSAQHSPTKCSKVLFGWLVFPFFETKSSNIQGPELTMELKYEPNDEERMRRKIQALLHGATMSKCEACVFSAFGCGAFGNPPDEVARLFKEELCKVNLRQVTFCIVDDHNARRRHNPRGNFRPFQDAFQHWNPWRIWRETDWIAWIETVWRQPKCAATTDARWKIAPFVTNPSWSQSLRVKFWDALRRALAAETRFFQDEEGQTAEALQKMASSIEKAHGFEDLLGGWKQSSLGSCCLCFMVFAYFEYLWVNDTKQLMSFIQVPLNNLIFSPAFHNSAAQVEAMQLGLEGSTSALKDLVESILKRVEALGVKWISFGWNSLLVISLRFCLGFFSERGLSIGLSSKWKQSW